MMAHAAHSFYAQIQYSCVLVKEHWYKTPTGLTHHLYHLCELEQWHSKSCEQDTEVMAVG